MQKLSIILYHNQADLSIGFRKVFYFFNGGSLQPIEGFLVMSPSSTAFSSDQFQQFLQPFVSTGALLEGGNVAVLKKYCCLFLFILKIRNYSKIHRNFKKIY